MAALPETGGAATFVRRAINDLAGFMTGWALFLDYLIVIALSALFVPHYLCARAAVHAFDRNPWDVVVAVGVIVDRRGDAPRPAAVALRASGSSSPALDLLTQLVLVVLGFVLVFSPHALTHGTSLGTHPSWHSIAFALPLAMLAFTGLETVANLAEEARRPGRRPAALGVRRDRDGGDDLRRDRRRRRVGVPGRRRPSSARLDRAPLARGRRPRSAHELPWPLGGVLRVFVGAHAAR